MSDLILCDAHTHGKFPQDGHVFRIVQLDDPNAPQSELPPAFSIGIHPQDIATKHLDAFRHFSRHPGLKAIGECGMDRLVRTVAPDEQKRVFLEHANLAQELDKPLIIHCVRFADEIIAVRKKLQPTIPWVYHGFRGNERKAMDLVGAGFYLSFGAGLLRDAGNVEPFFTKIPQDRILIETDADDADLLPQILATVAQMSAMDMLTCSALILDNFRRVYRYAE